MKKLFAPEHACKGLALHQPRIGIGNGTLQSGIKLIRLGAAAGNPLDKKSKPVAAVPRGKQGKEVQYEKAS